MITEILVLGCIVSAIFGLLFGSFAGATVWRLRARQLVEEDTELLKLDEQYRSGAQLPPYEEAYRKELQEASKAREAELRRLRPILQPIVSDRSRCLHCHHELVWYDLLPLVSWASTKGKCRYCKKKIGRFEPTIEIGTAVLFAAIFAFWSVTGGTWWELAFELIITVMLIILFAYDLKWFILPDVVIWPLIGLSVIGAVYQVVQHQNLVQALLSLIGGIAVLAGLYLVLWLYSKGQWVGFGDVKLGLGLGLLLADWQLAFLTLFLANLIGTVIVIPGLVSGKIQRTTKVPFGPLLIAGFVVALFAGPLLLDWYTGVSIAFVAPMLML